MCDASDYAVGAVLGQTKDKKHHAIAYANKTLTGAQLNYATIEKELLTVVFAIDKFRSYLVGTKLIVYTDHAALKYLTTREHSFSNTNLCYYSLINVLLCFLVTHVH